MYHFNLTCLQKSQVSGKEEELISANKELKKEHKKRMSDAEKRVKDR